MDIKVSDGAIHDGHAESLELSDGTLRTNSEEYDYFGDAGRIRIGAESRSFSMPMTSDDFRERMDAFQEESTMGFLANLGKSVAAKLKGIRDTLKNGLDMRKGVAAALLVAAIASAGAPAFAREATVIPGEVTQYSIVLEKGDAPSILDNRFLEDDLARIPLNEVWSRVDRKDYDQLKEDMWAKFAHKGSIGDAVVLPDYDTVVHFATLHAFDKPATVENIMLLADVARAAYEFTEMEYMPVKGVPQSCEDLSHMHMGDLVALGEEGYNQAIYQIYQNGGQDLAELEKYAPLPNYDQLMTTVADHNLTLMPASLKNIALVREVSDMDHQLVNRDEHGYILRDDYRSLSRMSLADLKDLGKDRFDKIMYKTLGGTASLLHDGEIPDYDIITDIAERFGDAPATLGNMEAAMRLSESESMTKLASDIAASVDNMPEQPYTIVVPEALDKTQSVAGNLPDQPYTIIVPDEAQSAPRM